MLNLKKLFSKVLDNLTYLNSMIVTEEYDLGVITYTAGTVGSTYTVLSTDIAKPGYTAVSVSIRYVSSSVVGFCPFFNSTRTTLYTQIIRRASSAFTATYNAYAIVTYIKDTQ